MSIRNLLKDYNIPFVEGGEHPHSTIGWININCPFCGGKNYQLGINESNLACNCWRCGGHSIANTLSLLLNEPYPVIKQILKKYSSDIDTVPNNKPEIKVSIHPFKLPEPVIKLNKFGKKYLRDRNFNPEELEKKWDLLQTTPISKLDNISYKNRILIPIWRNGELVSFQTRDITNSSDKRYIACPANREKISHKHIVYAHKNFVKQHSLIIVEGVTDVWRLGENAVATFGISFTMEQVLTLKNMANKFFVLFDNESQAQEQARKLAIKLKTLGKQVDIITVDTDPADMKQEDADKLIKNLIY